MRTFSFFSLLIGLVLTASLQAQTVPTYRQVLDGLATPAANAGIALPANFFKFAATDNRGKLQRGVVLYAAAGRAKEIENKDRAPVLLSSAKTYLQQAYNGLSASTQKPQKSQAAYMLGQIAELHEGNLASAKTHYQNAVNLQTNYQPAVAALARVTRLQQGNP